MTKSLTFYAILILFILTACGPKSLSLKNKLSSPAHHVEVGMVLFEKDKLAEAAREFQLALEMEPKLGKAHIGLALVEVKRWFKIKLTKFLLISGKSALYTCFSRLKIYL